MQHREALLTAPSDLKWKNSTRAEFSVPNLRDEGRTIACAVVFKPKNITHPKYGYVMGYDVSFFQVRHEKSPWQYKALSDGDLNPFQVFGGVMQAVREFLLKQKPNFMWFVADEPERARLYNRLLPKMTVPGYRAEVTDDGKYTVVKEAGAVVARFKQAVRDVGIEPT